MMDGLRVDGSGKGDGWMDGMMDGWRIGQTELAALRLHWLLFTSAWRYGRMEARMRKPASRILFGREQMRLWADGKGERVVYLSVVMIPCINK